MKLTKAIALILAAVLLCGTVLFPACAESDYQARQMDRFKQMQNRTISVRINCSGGYVLKSMNFYAREVIGVDANGNFILSHWKLLDHGKNMPIFTHDFTVSGTCVVFAYSCDIFWGTDFPYSGVFWNDTSRDVKSVEINMAGLVRCVDIGIKVNGTTVFSDSNCAAHSEWTPW